MNDHTQKGQSMTPSEVRAFLTGEESNLTDASRRWRWSALAGKPGMRSPQHEQARKHGWHIVVPESEVSNGDA